MARVVSHYTAVMTNTGYIYDRPSPDGDSTQYDYGQELVLPADYGSRQTDGYYPVTYPENNGWIHHSIVGSITAVYQTVTDACTAPTSVTLNTGTKVLTISGGAGGDLNTFSGYQISWRDAVYGTTSYGSWSSDVTVSTTNTTATYSVTAPAGYTRQFRARTIGSAGSNYYSAYVTCATTLTGNTAPSAPAFKLPAANATTNSQTPVIVVTVSADKDSDTLTLKRKIDSGSWTNLTTLKSGTYYDQLPTLANGAHTVYYKVADPYAESGEVSRAFTVSVVSWKRSIQTGTVISNTSVSHVADINEMLAVLNRQRAFYGLGTVTLPGTLGRFGDWKSQMEKFQTAIVETGKSANKTISFDTVPSYPTASIINAIRTQLKAF